MTIYLDPEIRAHLVEYFTKCINHSYDNSKYVRLLLKAQNLSVNDILIPSQALLQAAAGPDSSLLTGNDAKNDTCNSKIIEQTKIKPIPSNKDIDDLEHCYNNLELLTTARQKFVLDNFKSRKDNTVTYSNGDTLSPARRKYVDICLGIIAKKENKNNRKD